MELQRNIMDKYLILLTYMELQENILYKYFNSAHLHRVPVEHFVQMYKYFNSAQLHGVAEERFVQIF
jgi:hypothetical protein